MKNLQIDEVLKSFFKVQKAVMMIAMYLTILSKHPDLVEREIAPLSMDDFIKTIKSKTNSIIPYVCEIERYIGEYIFNSATKG